MNRKRVLRGIAAGIAAVLSAAAAEAAPAVEIRLGFGGWTLAPFHSPVESRSEDVIQDQYEALLKAALPDWAVTPVDADIELSSSGRTFYAEAWLPLKKGRFAVGIRGDLFSFRIPYTAAAHETLVIGGLPLAELWGLAAGTVTLEGFGVSLLGRWLPVSTRNFDLAVRTGVSVLPFRGRVTTAGTLRIETILGEETYSDGLNQSIAELRENNEDIPRVIFAPVLGFEAGYRFLPRWRLIALASVSQGTFYSLGIAASF